MGNTCFQKVLSRKEGPILELRIKTFMDKFDEQLSGIFLTTDTYLLSRMTRKTTRSPFG